MSNLYHSPFYSIYNRIRIYLLQQRLDQLRIRSQHIEEWIEDEREDKHELDREAAKLRARISMLRSVGGDDF